jgi:hypothetical protein
MLCKCIYPFLSCEKYQKKVRIEAVSVVIFVLVKNVFNQTAASLSFKAAAVAIKFKLPYLYAPPFSVGVSIECFSRTHTHAHICMFIHSVPIFSHDLSGESFKNFFSLTLHRAERVRELFIQRLHM